ncbi:hypothetical protein PsAD2_04392 [Pseudovibrio axinellae]|uniref:YjiS-like domain-containing protein n=1 Tax=Pseudovibrio axinellae TaxID=989403 RepID=A0A165T5M0_9HYPH|nr:DUF1127 domain-containing protein [Pseudovibrio axinellae]KZL05467.1 hypothetical protein PsAD2_04392 [Pseudovibrio axinellae]SEP98036.1 protein of unknown function [Pseudovibrio axinellae]
MTLAFPTPSEFRNANRANAGTFEPLTLSHTLHVLVAIPMKLWKHYQDRRAMIELAGLEDRMLEDIGITRADVHSALSASDGHDPSWHLSARARERRCAELEKRRRHI